MAHVASRRRGEAGSIAADGFARCPGPFDRANQRTLAPESRRADVTKPATVSALAGVGRPGLKLDWAWSADPNPRL